MLDAIKRLREATSLSIAKIKEALERTDGDEEKALELLRVQSKDVAVKKGGRSANEGIVESYIHATGKIGVLLELHCETDFVARNPEFKELAHNVAMHIAAMNPQYVRSEDIPEHIRQHDKELHEQELEGSGKPEAMRAQIIEGKLKKQYEALSLMTQPYVKDQDKSIAELVNEHISKLGENIKIGNFVRFEI